MINIISARGGRSGVKIYLFDPKIRIWGSGTIAIGFGSKFRADSRYPDPEISVLGPFRTLFTGAVGSFPPSGGVQTQTLPIPLGGGAAWPGTIEIKCKLI